MNPPDRPPLLTMRGVQKPFGATYELKGVDLTVLPGEVHALIGENGEGKSTLMKTLSGAYSADVATMEIAAHPNLPRSPLHARSLGVCMIYQELGMNIIIAGGIDLSAFRFAVGSNEKTALLCGVPVNFTKLMVYLIGGLFSGFAGILYFARLGSIGQPTEAIGYELFVIAAAVIGGASLLGGGGTILGTMIGALIITILRNGGVKMGWPQYPQEIVMGAVIIVAVAIDNLRNRKRS